MRALIVAFYLVLGLFFLSTLIYIAQSEKNNRAEPQKEVVENQSDYQHFRR